MLNRFELKIVDGICEAIAINGTELRQVEGYKIEQTENSFAKVTVSFFADTMNIFVGKEEHHNADPATGTK